MIEEKNIRIEYDGEYPNLCSGQLIVYIDEDKWVFPKYCLSSGGSVSFDDDWNEEISHGPWCVNEWPNGFPEELKELVTDVINDEIPHGCCGGCV